MTIARLPPDVHAAAVALRRELHRQPELSGAETATSDRVARALRALGLSPRSVGGTGLIADVIGDPNGPRVALRADLDALPIQEATGLPFASRVPGVMHACGHDVHSAALVAAAAMLVESPPPGVVRLLFQPAEETGNGAARCVKDGALDGFDAVIGGHVDLDYPVGTVALQPGPMCAGTDHFRITVIGRGGHGARPHQGTDALLAGAQIVTALQSVVAREIEPGRPAVLHVGTFHSGERRNILAGSATLEGTLRSGSAEVRAHLKAAVMRVAQAVASAAGATAQIEIEPGNEPVVNDDALTDVVRTALAGAGLRTAPLVRFNTGGEDFSDLTKGRAGVYVRWGAAGPESGSAPAHSAGFRVDEGVIDAAALGLAAAARAAVAWPR
jgi:amidohydrolase